MPAPSSNVIVLLSKAKEAEAATAGTGVTFLATIRDELLSVAQAGGLKMISAATAGKSFSFADGWSTSALADAWREAFGIWMSCTAAQITTIVNGRLERRAVGVFRGVPSYQGPLNGWGSY